MTQQLIRTITTAHRRTKLPKLAIGDVVKVMQKVKEGDKERLQPLEGTIISMKHGVGTEGMITIRAKYGNYYMERTFPLHSPKISSIKVLRHSKVRRAKLYYVRQQTGKKSSMRRINLSDTETAAEVVQQEVEAVALPKEAATAVVEAADVVQAKPEAPVEAKEETRTGPTSEVKV